MLGGIGVVEAVSTMPAFASCPQEFFTSITGHSAYHLPAAGTHFKDGPGGTIVGKVDTATTVSASGTVSAGASISGILASAKVEVSASITKSKSITVGHSYSHNIAARKYGHIQYGSWGYKVNWKYQKQMGNCTFTTLSTGTAKVPTDATGWHYWETSS
jgi:hypothetical protein